MNDITRGFSSRLHELAAEHINQLPINKPEFSLAVQWSTNYDDLFSKLGEISAEEEILERLLRRGRCILIGRGGGGKTRLLHRCMRAMLEKGYIPIFVDLKNWTGPDYGSWHEWISSDIGAGASFLLERFSAPTVDALTLDALPPQATKILIVDGLNEIAATEGQQILLALDDFARDQVGMSILVADRLSRRDLPSQSRWALGAVQPISKDEIGQYFDLSSYETEYVEALSIPYFLDEAIRNGAIGLSRVETLHQFLAKHGDLSPDESRELAATAFNTYVSTSSRTFQRESFELQIGRSLTNRLIAAGILAEGNDQTLHFAHHLLHDYLAAQHVSQMVDNDWVGAIFQSISFGGSSFDTISMVFSMLAHGRSDDFLRKIYDWNPYAAAYALADAATSASPPSAEIQTVILAMLAEKVFDLVEPTSQRARDALALIDTPEAYAFRNCNSVGAVLAIVQSVNSSAQWFLEWRRVFLLGAEDLVTDEHLKQIGAGDSITGWTMANIFKRIKLGSHEQGMLRQLADSADATVRWRVAHALGAWPSVENVRTLAQLLSDMRDDSVRYGALRSLIEAAARGDADVRAMVVEQIAALAASVAQNSKLVDEARRAMWIFPSQAPKDWLTVIRRISLLLYEFDDEIATRDYWKMYVEKSSMRYRHA